MTDLRAASRVAFAEYAEVLGVDTDMIVGLLQRPGEDTVVVFSPDRDRWEEMYSIRMHREADNVLVQVGERRRFEL